MHDTAGGLRVHTNFNTTNCHAYTDWRTHAWVCCNLPRLDHLPGWLVSIACYTTRFNVFIRENSLFSAFPYCSLPVSPIVV